MLGVICKPDTQTKLQILSADAQYDLACACGTDADEHRRRGGDGKWIYPVTLPSGGRNTLFKTLISNVCTNDCKYCPLRQQQDIRRCTLGAEETAMVFLDYYNRKKVFGLFLSSGVCGSADAAMDRLNTTAKVLRDKHEYRGYIHLKILPGASGAAIQQAVSLASAVSLNIETPGQDHLAKLSTRKNYISDIVEPIKLISKLTARGSRYARVKQTTQFVVGAAGESDAEIVGYMWGLYDRLKLHRVYFSAYQKGAGDESMADGFAAGQGGPTDTFMREHRLYQVDFLLRKYGFTEADIVFDPAGRLSLTRDPKECWAMRHPERFPVNLNRASRYELLRVPGLGPVTVSNILGRRQAGRITSLEQVGKVGARLTKAAKYLTF
jgi:predicted DNA-binding helix-hairpin-helix protein